jgi:hypothetical protein
MFRITLAAAAVILLGLGAAATAQEAAPEPPRNRLSPTDDSELPQRTVPPLAPPHPLIQRRISEPPAPEPPPQSALPQTKTPLRAKAPPQAKPQPAMKHRVATKQLAKPGKAQRVVARRAAPPRHAVAARTYRQDDTSLGALFTAGRTPPGRSPEAPPSTLTYNYFGTTPAPRGDDAAPCPTRSRTSLSALFTCTLR